MDRTQGELVLVVDHDFRLVDAITDSQVRRAVVVGMSLDDPIKVLRDHGVSPSSPKPMTASVDTDPSVLLQWMREQDVQEIPLLDETQRVIGLVTRDDLVPNEALPLECIVMVGGYGSRLRSVAGDLPKALLPLGKRPLLEWLLDQLRQAGVQRVYLATHYKTELFVQHFGDGQNFGVEIRYLTEDQPLGTAGALSLLTTSDRPTLVVNGDLLTRLNFRAMLRFHHEHTANLTVAVCQHAVGVPYGIVTMNGLRVTGLVEKPTVQHFINAGIYLLDPQACRCIPSGVRYDMTQLINQLVREGRHVMSFPIWEYWVDIGDVENYQRAVHDVAEVFHEPA